LVGGDNIIADYYSSLFGCQVVTFLMKYLGVPVTHRTLRVSDLDPLDAKFIKKKLMPRLVAQIRLVAVSL
jgi:hypothetical protein